MSVQNGIKDRSLNLECGTSLAELEYASELELKQRQEEEEKKQESSILAQNNNMSNGQHQGNVSDKLYLEQQINSIRNSLSDDIVTKTAPATNTTATAVLSMFTSPFETPQARHGSSQTEIPEVERYAPVPLIYCDQTASNRPLKSIEKYIHDTCLPLYGNTHTNTSVTGSQSTAFIAEARQIVAEGVNAKITGKAALDVVLFA